MKNICIIFGGISCEHEVSRISAVNVLRNLDKKKYHPYVIEITKDRQYYLYEYHDNVEYYQQLVQINNKLDKEKIVPDIAMFQKMNIDVVFPVLHGTKGEDGTLQGYLDLCNVAYVGSDVLSSAICMDKVLCKDILVKNGIAVADYLWFSCEEIKKSINKVVKSIESKFAYPVFIKPSECGSSVGISKAKNADSLKKALVFAAMFSRKVLVEEFIEGDELEVAVLGSYEKISSSGVGQILSSNEFYDYNAKYIDGKSSTLLKPDIPDSSTRQIKKIAEQAFRCVGCYGMARIDFFLTKGKKAIVNEINTIPGFTDISMYPKLWDQSGISYTKLLDKLIKLAEERKEKYIFETDYEGIRYD
ncbi:MAG: D-alanine--D-alanine ligase [Clostridia bacterium]|jgi:D-alanine-D-alanine ligase|nr:D-alanine--D-alanine ligase [Clostridia bacterium]MDD3092556.1 D-alanine--D-alanine ligase [Clostridia bacterium]MDD4542457.1 D-alanine--D-alanine ligase [Clostridia bacterium]HPJ76931.1 D-alanine--D-alanine ligase family protein [Clostridia bacterium]HXK71274.1 D-alanine--D-alanine ligase family protein [Clostridia bacterium]